ncbi:bifunctional glutamate N-acetyltransferase/amino-acid acetyltransferase ArgJ [Candidatus Woesearchaeota archaeon]|nr:bifunctional glutamate N-acetyltransferase/amino-acid acetyltransferase ArgJ [Candidatus Woesearchaeota archaeon]
MKILNGDITAVKGIKALGKHIGIKKKSMDLAVIFSEKKANTAAVYTQNKVKGAPLYVTEEHLKDGKAQAIIVNSGIANVCTGKKGIDDAKAICRMASKELDIEEDDVLVASTGVIGPYLPMDKIEKGIKGIKQELNKDHKAGEAILTTDKKKKCIAVKAGNAVIGAIAKGSGMIHPNMATMLCFICTDAEISSSKLKQMIVKSVNKSFNMISVDMDTSTSDMVVLMANGESGKTDEEEFQKALDLVCVELAKKIAADGEGATKLIECRVKGAAKEEDAIKAAKSVITSNLVKCMFFGEDPNWGRIMGAAGYSGADIKEELIDIYINGMKIVSGGKGVEDKGTIGKIKKTLGRKEVFVLIDLNEGKKEATAYGCDLTTDYVKLNAHYST